MSARLNEGFHQSHNARAMKNESAKQDGGGVEANQKNNDFSHRHFWNCKRDECRIRWNSFLLQIFDLFDQFAYWVFVRHELVILALCSLHSSLIS